MTKRVLDVTKSVNIGVDDNGDMIYAKVPRPVDIHLWNRALTDISTNNTWCPDVVRIIFNVGERTTKFHMEKQKNGVEKKVVDATEPTLATTVFFNDNTKVTCLNSIHDKITLVEDKKTGAMTASDVDKERGVVYCVVKKLISTIDPCTGEMKTEGFGRILRELVASGWDQAVEDKRAALKKAEQKAAFAAKVREAASKPKRKDNASLYETVNHLAEVVDKLDSKINWKVPVVPKSVASKKEAKKTSKQKRNAKGQFI